MTAKQLFDAGKVREAEKALSAYVRDHPADVSQRTFLFELLCFSGQYDRAQRQLTALSGSGAQAELGAILYLSALHAEKTRHETFQKQEFPKDTPAPSRAGTLNGKPFQSIRDADPDIGARLEVYAAGAYLWIAFEHIASIEMQPPRKLRDTLWAPAVVRTGPSFKGTELGEVLLPVIYPFSWKNPDESVWLGRSTEWAGDDEGKEYPSGQKLLLVDGDEVPFLEIRSIEFADREGVAPAAQS
ncbi:MAG TPA: type VI secretion system accessory protein TagJ [Terriglobia bacterium]|nr:type VI secretion system accessory protein TagJ [Terriglobia bacterium]